MVNGQATSALLASRNVFGLIGQTQAALNPMEGPPWSGKLPWG